MIIDGTNLILGRLSTYVAKRALEGEPIVILNCENIVITGKRKFQLSNFLYKQHMGNAIHGPFIPRIPDRIVKRAIRGMLPYKQERGRKAFNRIKCYIGVPEQYKNTKPETLQSASYEKLKTLNFITVNDLAKVVGKGVA